MQRVASGDREAFHQLYQRWAGRLLNLLQRQCGRSSEAEDLLQEVFLTVWRKASSFDTSRGDLGGWLFMVCRNRAIDRIRRRRDGESLENLRLQVAPSRLPEQRFDLDYALKVLAPKERIAVQLAYFGDLTYEETALELDLPIGTLKSRIRSGLRKMAKRLRNDRSSP